MLLSMHTNKDATTKQGSAKLQVSRARACTYTMQNGTFEFFM
jgi:hypothetical protein